MPSTTKMSERVLLDAGVLIGALMKGDQRHSEARPLVEAARSGDLPSCTTTGILSEVYAALTWQGAQPPQSPEAAAKAVRLLVDAPSAILVLSTGLEASVRMLELASRFRLTARRIHDARHAEIALESDVVKVDTYDVDDWRLFEPDGLRIVGPPSML